MSVWTSVPQFPLTHVPHYPKKKRWIASLATSLSGKIAERDWRTPEHCRCHGSTLSFSLFFIFPRYNPHRHFTLMILIATPHSPTVSLAPLPARENERGFFPNVRPQARSLIMFLLVRSSVIEQSRAALNILLTAKPGIPGACGKRLLRGSKVHNVHARRRRMKFLIPWDTRS